MRQTTTIVTLAMSFGVWNVVNVPLQFAISPLICRLAVRFDMVIPIGAKCRFSRCIQYMFVCNGCMDVCLLIIIAIVYTTDCTGVVIYFLLNQSSLHSFLSVFGSDWCMVDHANHSTFLCKSCHYLLCHLAAVIGAIIGPTHTPRLVTDWPSPKLKLESGE